MAKIVFDYPFMDSEYEIKKESLMVGRDPKNDIVIPDYSLFKRLSHTEQKLYVQRLKNVSRIHAKITLKDGKCFIEDVGTRGLGSNYGTYVNDIRIEVKNPYPMENEDRIKFGHIEASFKET